MTDHAHCPHWAGGADECCQCGHREQTDDLRDRVAEAVAGVEQALSDRAMYRLSGREVTAITDAVMPVIEAEQNEYEETVVGGLNERVIRLEKRLAYQKTRLLEALGMDPTRDWDDIRNAAACFRRQTETERDAREAENALLRRWARHHHHAAIRARHQIAAVAVQHLPETVAGVPTGLCAECEKPVPCPTRQAVPRPPEVCDCSPECPVNAGYAFGSYPDGQVLVTNPQEEPPPGTLRHGPNCPDPDSEVQR